MLGPVCVGGNDAGRCVNFNNISVFINGVLKSNNDGGGKSFGGEEAGEILEQVSEVRNGTSVFSGGLNNKNGR